MLSVIKYTAISVFCIGALCVLWFYIRSRKPVRLFFLNLILTACAAALINLTSKYTGVHIPLNPYTAALFSVFGIPAVTGILILNLIMAL